MISKKKDEITVKFSNNVQNIGKSKEERIKEKENQRIQGEIYICMFTSKILLTTDGSKAFANLAKTIPLRNASSNLSISSIFSLITASIHLFQNQVNQKIEVDTISILHQY